MSIWPPRRSFNMETSMQQHPTVQDVVDHFEQLLIRIMLTAISQLVNEIVGIDDESEVDF